MKHHKLLLFTLLLSLQCWIHAQEPTMGLIYHSDEAFEGYTLMSNNGDIYLIDNCGRIVKQWQSEYKTGHGLYLTSNGDVLRAGSLEGTFDAGGRGGIFELFDWSGALKWQYTIAEEDRHAHHDIALLPNGNFLCTVWERKNEAEAKAQGRKYDGEVWSERILEVEILEGNQANIVWEWSVWDHLVQDFDADKANFGNVGEHPELLDLNYIGAGEETFGNWLHINAVSYHPEFDQIVLSSRNLSEIYVIDHSTTTVEAASHSGGRYGKGGDILFRYGNPQVYRNGDENDQILFRQHHINWVLEGSQWQNTFSVFNNEYIGGEQSNVFVFSNPANQTGHYSFDAINGFGTIDLLASYTHPDLYSDILSGVQVFPNGNWLILEGRSGHLTEINSNGDTVWEYIYPVNRNGGAGIQGGTPQFNLLFRAIRYAPDYAGLQDKSLIPTIPIELAPYEPKVGCEYFNPTENEGPLLQLLGNPIHNQLIVQSNAIQPLEVEIFNTLGERMGIGTLVNGINEWELMDLLPGLYYLFSKEEDLGLKFLKI